MKTLDEQRTETAARLSDETGFEVTWMKSCFSLWDGTNRWFPLYTTAQVLSTAGRLRRERIDDIEARSRVTEDRLEAMGFFG